MNQKGEGGGRGERRRTLPEWATLAISCLIVLGVVGSIGYNLAFNHERPPAFEVTANSDRVRESDGRYYLPVRLRNTGSRTAEEVMVRVSLAPAPSGGAGGRGGDESSEFTIRFLGGGETADAVVVFGQDPRERGVTIDIVSYLVP